MQVDFAPDQISYDALLDLFWRSHSPTRPREGSQYRSMILASEAHLERARSSHAAAEGREQRRLYTDVVPYERFTLAEDDHQKWYLRRVRPLRTQLLARFPNNGAFVDSTAVARLNGFAGGHAGGRRQLGEQREALGLDEASYEALLELL